jgi:UDP-N-acetylmuramyl-tripeptide synthetase
MISLHGLLKGQAYQSSQTLEGVSVTGISFDAHKVEPGHLFIAAKPLGAANIQEHIETALKRGVRCIVKDREISGASIPSSIVVVDVMDARLARARIAANVYPGQPDTVVAVTGTNGKTSVTHFLYQIWTFLGYQSACLGTAGTFNTLNLVDLPQSSLTSMSALHLHESLSLLKSKGCTHLALEASSHGLHQRRLDCLNLTTAGYTNLSHDHLDYHENMNAYFEAKSRLFTELLPEGSGAVLNADDFRFAALLKSCKERGHRVITFGRQSHDIQLVSVDLHDQGQTLHMKVFGRHYTVPLSLVGTIQSYNVMCALGLAIGTGAKEEDVLKVLSHLKSVPGRFEWVGSLKNGARVFVDFAHTPQGLETLLTSLRPHVEGTIHLVFGCGGDRDKQKRPMMGEIASKLAEHVYITDDNPRTETPALIRKEIKMACPEALDIPSRQEAIARALANCCEQDVCVIAGKGHEQGQIMKDHIIPFDDRLVAREEIVRLEGTIK